MEHLRIAPEKMYRRYKHTDGFPYTFADILIPHMNVSPYTGYIASLDEYCLKNIWNHLVHRWTLVRRSLTDNKTFRNSKYNKLKIDKVGKISREELDHGLYTFIHSDKFLALFVIITIQGYLFPV
jgi:hypothetical protein